MRRGLAALALVGTLISSQADAAQFTPEEEAIIRSKTAPGATDSVPITPPSKGKTWNPDEQAARYFAKQTKDNRFVVPKSLSDKYCNPYFDKPVRLDAICTVVWLERPAADPVTYRIDRNAIESAWQLIEAIDARAISERNAAAALSRIIKTHGSDFDRYVAQRVQIEAARQSAPVVMPYQGDPGAVPAAPSTPVRTRCDRVPFSVTGTVNCVTE